MKKVPCLDTSSAVISLQPRGEVCHFNPLSQTSFSTEKTVPQAKFSILTVHSVQSKEWDTVIFSVVDGANKFFTGSQNHYAHESKVINIAVSRAKKRLFIVCDVAYWSTQPNQLIA